MFRLSTSRQPTPEELAELQAFFADELARFETEPDAAQAFLNVGEYHLETEVSPVEWAAYAIVANAIFNLDESITKS
jgi:hypothetical protein